MQKEQWDERYQQTRYAYGREPNQFFKRVLDDLTPGLILMPADGEGRNGVYAATRGWKVTSCDLSVEGKTKALQLARDSNAKIEYQVGDLEDLSFGKESFDVIGLIYAHFPAEKRSALHRKLIGYLRPGGIIILEGFGKGHLEFKKHFPRIGGPADLDSLFSTSEIAEDFANFHIKSLEETSTLLNEGHYHIGQGSVVRFVGQKPGGDPASAAEFKQIIHFK
jgi:SAM-dependent methyltransferase